MQQLVHRVDFALGFDLLDLPGDLAVVDRGVLDGPDYSQGDGVVGVLHRRQHRVERRVALVGVVRQHVVQRVAVLTDGYDLQLHVLEDDAFLLVGSEQHLLAVAQRYGALRTRSLVGGELAVGLVGMAGALATVTISVNLMPKNMISI